MQGAGLSRVTMGTSVHLCAKIDASGEPTTMIEPKADASEPKVLTKETKARGACDRSLRLDRSSGRGGEAHERRPQQVRSLLRAGPAQPGPEPRDIHLHRSEDGTRHSQSDQVDRGKLLGVSGEMAERKKALERENRKQHRHAARGHPLTEYVIYKL